MCSCSQPTEWKFPRKRINSLNFTIQFEKSKKIIKYPHTIFIHLYTKRAAYRWASVNRLVYQIMQKKSWKSYDQCLYIGIQTSIYNNLCFPVQAFCSILLTIIIVEYISLISWFVYNMCYVQVHRIYKT